MLLLAARRTEGLQADPPPFVFLKQLDTFIVLYELNAYCNDASQMTALYSAMHRNVLDVFNEHGVQIMTPAYEGDPESPKIVPPEKWHLSPAGPQAERK
jgi:small-conductance mechanosensitive channel